MVDLTQEEIDTIREERYHERELQETYIKSDRTDKEKIKYLRWVQNGSWLFRRALKRLEKHQGGS